MRTTPLLIIVFAAATAGCATPGARALPVCDGKHLRPANLHGSVLDAPAPAVPTTAPSTAADAAQHRFAVEKIFPRLGRVRSTAEILDALG